MKTALVLAALAITLSACAAPSPSANRNIPTDQNRAHDIHRM